MTGLLVHDWATDRDLGVARFLADGTLDTSFATNGILTIDAEVQHLSTLPADVVIDDQDRILFADGLGTAGGTAIYRITPTGQLDASFDGDGAFLEREGLFTGGSVDNPEQLHLNDDGRILLSGFEAVSGPHLIALNRFVEAQTVQVNAPPNLPPQFTTEPAYVDVDARIVEVRLGNSFTYDADAVDPDGHDVTFSIVSGPDNFDFATAVTGQVDGKVAWTTQTGDTGDHQVVIRATDELGAFTD